MAARGTKMPSESTAARDVALAAPRANVIRFADGDSLAHALADRVANDIARALADAPRATLALSGGNTPRRFFMALSQRELPWSRVDVVPVDERWVPPTHERANARLLREHLFQHHAKQATFVPLYADTATPEASLDVIEARVRALSHPFAAVVLGMGDDGHTASWFPGGDHLASALDPDEPARVVTMRAPGAPEPRITLTLPAVLDTPALHLHIEGPSKQRVLDRALAGDALPVTVLLQHAPRAPDIYWCP
jgi:6-phosphogluconolactonase